jgi:hypothetical protein
MIWNLIRIWLVVASVCAFVFILRAVVKDPHSEPFWGADVIIPASFALNVAYLLFGAGRPTRMLRLFSLWLDAKEAELRKRAGREEISN